MARWIFFFIAVLLGILAGMYYGWVINPVEYVDTAPDSLRIDYKTDYVLMVAEVYGGEGDLDLAVRRLALLGDTPPTEMVVEAMLYAVENGYGEYDLALMQALADALQSWIPGGEAPGP
jgi:hypothetical protein